MYFGYAGEFNDIKIKNPHLNFDVAEVPQIKDGNIRATIGKIYSLAISKTSPNAQTAFMAIFKLIDKNINKQFSEITRLAPARRDIISDEGSSDPILSVFYKSAIMAKSWLEPNPQLVSRIFQNMIESTVSSKAKISEAVKDAERQMEELMK
jgi:maltose-binding protein MalE